MKYVGINNIATFLLPNFLLFLSAPHEYKTFTMYQPTSSDDKLDCYCYDKIIV